MKKKTNFFNSLELPFVLMGAGLLFLIVLIIYLSPIVHTKNKDHHISLISSKFEQFEKKLMVIEMLDERLNQIEVNKNIDLKEFEHKLQRLEANLLVKLELISRKLDNIKYKTYDKKKVQNKSVEIKAVEIKQNKKLISKKEKKKICTYIVKPGQHLYGISKDFGLTIKQLQEINKLNKRTNIYPGQQLKVPCKK